ncbi:hypothetical protein C8Q78DRAFT_992976 [Trametes maxima]|nr:hypothetical protein C8Q78DRAFT_992976 [Trametes maxima]
MLSIRVSIALAISALPILTVATPLGARDDSCSTGEIQCCQTTTQASSPAASQLLGLLGVVLQDMNVPVGLNCSPISVIGVGAGNGCSANTVCCEDNSFSNVFSFYVDYSVVEETSGESFQDADDLPHSAQALRQHSYAPNTSFLFLLLRDLALGGVVTFSRNEYTREDDNYLAQYIAKYNPGKEGRLGNKLYQRLCDNSWREHYKQNSKYLDAKIARFIPRYHKNLSPTPPTSSPPPSSVVQYTDEDDKRLIEYLARDDGKGGSFLGEKFWKIMVDQIDTKPWVARHPWSSWRERYKKHRDYFEWAIRCYNGGDGFDEPQPANRPRTEEDYRVRRPSKNVVQTPQPARSAARKATVRDRAQDTVARKEALASAGPVGNRKRARASDTGADDRPAKKARAREEHAVEVEQDGSGPSAQSHAVIGEAVGAEQSEEPAETDRAEAMREDEGVEDDQACADGGEDTKGSEEDGDSSDEESGEEAPVAPPGSDDYQGEIFDASQHGVQEDNAPGEAPVDDGGQSSDSSQETVDQLFAEDADEVEAGPAEQSAMDIDGKTVVGDVVRQQERTENEAADQTLVATSNPALPSTLPHNPPARRHHQRIHDAMELTGTPEPSPTQEAAVRHHSPAPAPRRHAKRIKRAGADADDDYFGTPRPQYGDDGRIVSSPTTEAEARHHHDKPRTRALPRLEQGAFSKAFSDARGRSQISPDGKTRRRSGVAFEDEDEGDDELAGSQDSEGEDGEENEEHASELAQWPPIRRRRSVKGKAPAQAAPMLATPTPARALKRKDRGRMVMTEEVVSVRTVRTVERRASRPMNGTPFPRGALLAAAANQDEDHEDAYAEEAGSSPTPAQRDGDIADAMVEDHQEALDDTLPSLSQHHPFSQAPHPFSQSAEPSPVRPSTSTTSVWQKPAPMSKTDLSRLQRLLLSKGEEIQAQSTKAPTPAQEQRAKGGRLSLADRARLDNLLRVNVQDAFPEPSKQERQPVVANEPAEGEGFFSSPLADKGDRRPVAAEQQGQIVPPVASGSRDILESQSRLRVDKGKGRADADASPTETHHRRYTVGDEGTRDLFYEPAEQHATTGRAKTKRLPRQSLPAPLDIGDNSFLGHPTALSFAFGPPSLSYLRAASIPSTIALSRPVSASPSHSGTSSSSHPLSFSHPRVDALPPEERRMVAELGLQTALQIMARNHGFGTETVERVYAATGGLRRTDEVLRAMREAANERGSAEIMSSPRHQRDDDDDDNDANADEADLEPDNQPGPVEEGHSREEADEIERELTQRRYQAHRPWPQDSMDASFDLGAEMPLAESSRIEPSRSRGASGKERLRIEPLVEEHSASMEYSPPKRTRAGAHVRRVRESLATGQS